MVHPAPPPHSTVNTHGSPCCLMTADAMFDLAQQAVRGTGRVVVRHSRSLVEASMTARAGRGGMLSCATLPPVITTAVWHVADVALTVYAAMDKWSTTTSAAPLWPVPCDVHNLVLEFAAASRDGMSQSTWLRHGNMWLQRTVVELVELASAALEVPAAHRAAMSSAAHDALSESACHALLASAFFALDRNMDGVVTMCTSCILICSFVMAWLLHAPAHACVGAF